MVSHLRSWLYRLAMGTPRARLVLWLLVAMAVQILYWGVWAAYRYQPIPQPAPTAQAISADDPLELSSAFVPAPLAAWQMPRSWFDEQGQAELERMQPYWHEIETWAQGNGLVTRYKSDGETLVWQVQGYFSSLMAWLYELTLSHPRLTIKAIQVAPIERGVSVEAIIQLSVQPLASNFEIQGDKVHDFGLAVMALSQGGMGTADWHPVKSAREKTSPFGLAAWHDALVEYGILSHTPIQRSTPLMQHRLSDLKWVGSLVQQEKAVAWLLAGGQMWSVQVGDRIGQGLNRVVAITPDYVQVEVVSLSAHGMVDTQILSLAAIRP